MLGRRCMQWFERVVGQVLAWLGPVGREVMSVGVLVGGGSALLWDAALLPGMTAVLMCVVGLDVVDRMARRRAMRELLGVMDRVTDGDLSVPVVLGSEGADGDMAPRLERMQRMWSRLVANVRSEAELAASAGERMTLDARALSVRTEEQAASLEQTNASVTELAASVQSNAEAARLATQVADELRGHVERGLNVVEQAVDSVLRIEDRSSRMGQIISTIDSIAFQTNILALNAAVEAARAGESGRGFAVVAGEVRILSQRTAQAAAEVKGMIQGSTQEVETGVTKIREVSALLGSMVDGVRSVAQRIDQVASSTAVQSSSLGEIAQAVHSVDTLTQRNALMVDDSVRAADALRQQAESLKRGVSTMRLRQGCADEARNMVQRAVRCIAEQGMQRAIALFHDDKGPFRDRDLFVIVLDRRGYFRAFGADPSKADKPAVLPPGADVQTVVNATLHAADQGGGWVEFRSWHPVNKTPVDKMAYVLPAETCAVMVSANKSDGGDLSAQIRPLRDGAPLPAAQ